MKNSATNNSNIITNNTIKKAFTLVELSVVVVIITVILAGIVISNMLITSAKLNKINSDARDFQILTTVFQNTFDCLAGDCTTVQLPPYIINNTPSTCFNLQSDYVTPLTTPVINGFNTGVIDTQVKQACAFYELIVFEPTAFGLQKSLFASSINSIIGINSANAITPISFKNASTGGQAGKMATDCAAYTAVVSAPATLFNVNFNSNGYCTGTTIGTGSSCNFGSFLNNNAILLNSQNYCSSGNFSGTLCFLFNVPTLSGNYNIQFASYAGGTQATTPTWSINNGVQTGASQGGNPTTTIPVTSLQQGLNTICVTQPNNAANTNAVGCNGSSHCSGCGVAMSVFAFQIQAADGTTVFNPSGTVIGTMNYSITYNNSLFNGGTCSGVNGTNGYGSAYGTAYCTSQCKTDITANNNTGGLLNIISGLGSNSLSQYLVGVTNPATSAFQTQAMWALMSMNSSVVTAPYEASQLPGLQGKMMFVARSSSTNASNDASNPMAAFSANFTNKYDTKFDDGMPWTGNVIAGKNVADMNNTTGCVSTALSSWANVNSNLTANYISNGNKLSTGCNMSILINTQ